MFTCDTFTPRAQFHPLPDPTDAEVARVTKQIAARVMRLLRREGHVPEPDAPAEDGVDEEPGALDVCQAAAVQGRVALGPDAGRAVARLGRYRDATAADFRPGELCANVQGFSRHAATAVAAGRIDRLDGSSTSTARPALLL